MNRRSFLQLFGAGLPAVAVAEKIGLVERARSYFFAPKGGWVYPPPIPQQLFEYHREFEQITDTLTGLPYYLDVPLTVGTFYGISRKPLVTPTHYAEVDFSKALLIG